MWQHTTPPAPAPSITGVFSELQSRATAVVPGLVTAALVFAVFYLAARVGQRFIALTAPRVKADTGAVLLLSRVYYYGVLTFGLITALGTAGMNVTALVAGLGLTGFALGFALKDVLSNLVSGIMLLVYRPFQIGDQIRMGEYEGTIETIRMRDTVLRSFDGRYVIIPNTKLITEVVVNNSAAPLARATVWFELAEGEDGERALGAFTRAAGGHAAVGGRVEPPAVRGGGGGGRARLEGSFWYDPRKADRASVRGEVARSAERAFADEGVSAKAVEPTKEQPARPEEEAEQQGRPGPSAEAQAAAEARAHDS
ncbi:MAG TPA: mechanosensitive ion channel family protein [Pyrinomonadaceae bacterium]|jgi:small-conductance mechanosensitive channel